MVASGLAAEVPAARATDLLAVVDQVEKIILTEGVIDFVGARIVPVVEVIGQVAVGVDPSVVVRIVQLLVAIYRNEVENGKT